MEKKEIEAIIFDLGGVILDIDYLRTINAFKALGYHDFDEQYGKLKQSGLFDDLETGQIGEDEFVARIQKTLPHATKEEIINAWNAIILDFPAGRIEYLADVRKRLPVFLLSNTNEIHFKCFDQMLEGGIKDRFDKAYLSHEIKTRKPRSEAFQMILDKQGLTAETTLFIDDSPQHIESASKLGLQTIHLQSIHDLERELVPFLA